MESSVTVAPSQSLNEAFTVYRPDDQSSKTYPEVKNAQLKDESELSSSARSFLPEHQRLTEQRLEEKYGGRREGFTAHDFETTDGRKSSYFNSQETTPEKNLSTSPREVCTNPSGKYPFSFTPLRLIAAILAQNTKSILPNNREVQNNKTKRFDKLHQSSVVQ